MADELTIEIEGLDEIQAMYRLLPAEMEKALRTAGRRASSAGRRLAGRMMAQETGLPRSQLVSNRGRKRGARIYGEYDPIRLAARLWVGLNPIQARRLPPQRRQGRRRGELVALPGDLGHRIVTAAEPVMRESIERHVDREARRVLRGTRLRS